MVLQMEMLKVPDHVPMSYLSDLTRSDHVAFWHENLDAIFLTDTGKCQSLDIIFCFGFFNVFLCIVFRCVCLSRLFVCLSRVPVCLCLCVSSVCLVCLCVCLSRMSDCLVCLCVSSACLSHVSVCLVCHVCLSRVSFCV